MKKFLIFFIHLYSWLVSPLRNPSCRYVPSCSRYAIHALELHGVIKGSWLVIKRLLRCHPFESLGGGSGYDPVSGHDAYLKNVKH